MDPLPASWLATLESILRAPGDSTGAARAFGVTSDMVAAGWLARFEDESQGDRVTWTLTPYAAEMLGVCLVERAEGRPRWTRREWAEPVCREGGDGFESSWSYPDPPLVADRHPREVRRPDQVLLHVADPHSDPARAEARRRSMRKRKKRRRANAGGRAA